MAADEDTMGKRNLRVEKIDPAQQLYGRAALALPDRVELE